MPYDRQGAIAAAVASGLSPEQAGAQIDAYLASPAAQADSAAAASPPQAVASQGNNPIAGVLGGVADAAGGLRNLGLGVGGVGLGALALKGMRGRASAPKAAPAAATSTAPVTQQAAALPAAPAEAKLPSGWQRLTDDDFARHAKQLKGFKPGDPIQLKELQNIRLGKTTAPTPKSRSTAVAAKPDKPVARSTEPAVKRARAANSKLSLVEGEPPAGLTNRVTTLYGREGGPVKGLLPSNAESASNPELMRRAAQLSPGSRARAIAMESLGMDEQQLAAKLGSMGRSGLGMVGPPALELAMMLLGGASMPEDMQHAHDVYNEQAHPSAAARRALLGSQGF